MTANTGPRTADVLGTLTIDEKAALTAGSSMFAMRGVARLGMPDWMTTDGPNGARGSSLLGSGESIATCLPCGSALGATWDPALVHELGELLGRETRTKAARVLLAPTVNLHRSPLWGRNFEAFSEDPLLSGVLAAAYIRGVQSQGVVATVKHFVANEAETDRFTSNSIVDERALRELYLVPFEWAVKHGGVLAVMTAYNRLNGEWCANQRWLLDEVLRGEWGFEGLVMTDWMAQVDTVLASAAGLDVEMPAGDRGFGSVLANAVVEGRVSEAVLDRMAARILTVFERMQAWSDEPVAEQSIDRPEHRALARRAAADAMTLLRNDPVDGASVLPFEEGALRSIAVIGPNAARAQMMGGGSANLRPFHRTTILDALRARLGDRVSISYEPGCSIDKSAPLLMGSALVSPDGGQGFRVEVFDGPDWVGEPVQVSNRDTSRFLFGVDPIPATFSARAQSTYTPVASGPHTFELVQIGGARVSIDGVVVIDGIADPPPPGTAVFGLGAGPSIHTVELEAGRRYDLLVESTATDAVMLAGADLGVRVPLPSDAVARAVAAAAAADVAVVVVGTNDDWETEGEDRDFLGLPGAQDELVRAVAAANPRTVVVVNTGSPVAMPWVDAVPAVLQVWFGGQEMGDGIVDVLTGAAEPGGRLPTTFPLCDEHSPSFGTFPGDNGAVRYAEGVFVGYRWYDSRHLPVLFPFGHGLSYTSFTVGTPTVSTASTPVGDTITVDVAVTNTGDRRGSHVVQCYVRPHGSRLARPDKELKAFAKVALAPGATEVVHLTLDERAFAYWDPAQPEWPHVLERAQSILTMVQRHERRTEAGWTVEPGEYDLVIASSAGAIDHTVTITLT